MTKNLASFGAWVLAAACAAAPAPLAEPDLALRTVHVFAGGVATATNAPTTRAVRVEILALATAPAGRSLDDATLAVVASRGAPFRAVPNLPAGCRWLAADSVTALLAGDATAVQRLGSVAAPVVAGVETIVRPSLATLPSLRFLLENDRCRAIVEPPAGPDRATEQVLLDEPLTTTHVLFVPAPSSRLAGYAFSITVGDDVDAPTAAAALAAARAATPPPAADVAERERAIAREALGEHNRRPALLAIARRNALPRCLDAILAADEPLLVAMTAGLDAPPTTPEGAAWSFERAVFAAVLPAMQRDDLPPGVFACLVRHFGALALDATSLELQLDGAADAAAFDAAVQEENVRTLTSRDPVRRVRAHEWLVARGLAVPGYDPMADQAARRAALRRRDATAVPR